MQLLLRQIRNLHPLLPEGNAFRRHGQQFVFRPVDDPSAAICYGRLDIAHAHTVHRRHVVVIQQPRLDILLRIHGKRVVHARRVIIQLFDPDGIALDRQLRLFQILSEIRDRHIAAGQLCRPRFRIRRRKVRRLDDKRLQSRVARKHRLLLRLGKTVRVDGLRDLRQRRPCRPVGKIQLLRHPAQIPPHTLQLLLRRLPRNGRICKR